MKCELSARCASKKSFFCVFGGENNIYPTSDFDHQHLWVRLFLLFSLFNSQFILKLNWCSVCLADHLCSINGSYSSTSYDYSKPLIHTPLFSHTSVVSLRLRKILYDTMVGWWKHHFTVWIMVFSPHRSWYSKSMDTVAMLFLQLLHY